MGCVFASINREKEKFFPPDTFLLLFYDWTRNLYGTVNSRQP